MVVIAQVISARILSSIRYYVIAFEKTEVINTQVNTFYAVLTKKCCVRTRAACKA